jgi:mono/diheme cytochrome c family protein
VRIAWNRVGVIASIVGGIVFAAVAAGVSGAWVLYPRDWSSRPLPATRAVDDPRVIERGQYIVYGPGRCADCHTPDDARPILRSGETSPLVGGPGERTYLGTWTAPNLTPDTATGIGAVSDGQLARMIRHGIDRSGHIALPFMDSFADLTEADLVAVMSFLRSQPARQGTPPHAQVNWLGRIALAYFIEPYAPTRPIDAALTPEPTAAYGEYVARALAGCSACHTSRSLQTGRYLSPPFSGGLAFKSRLDPGRMYVSPNLTPDPATGRITDWTEDTFIARFRAGATIEDSPMPWGGFRRMTDVDLRALYRYLRALPPVQHDVGPTVQPLSGQTAG